ncbi:MAG: nuclear transport factor 2 family protein [Lewinellaceae bacterium]|nr:nuclear transport factor 2 family protein [Saprospiraceae bacterium]MCB9342388.1 nuclear transport factor 2 family protein [Lewinellaceae bacterium]
MKKNISAIYFLLLTGLLSAQTASETVIREIMATQEAAWNKGDLEAFMEGYWKSDSLKFIGSKGLNYGWQKTLENYKRSYPDPAAMGRLTFSDVTVELISEDAAFVIGKWHLKRKAGDLSGYYTLLWKKIKGEWVIVADHSS